MVQCTFDTSWYSPVLRTCQRLSAVVVTKSPSEVLFHLGAFWQKRSHAFADLKVGMGVEWDRACDNDLPFTVSFADFETSGEYEAADAG